MRIPVIYSQRMVAVSGSSLSPSAHKPALVAKALQSQLDQQDLEWIEPEAAELADFFRAHDPRFVKAVLEGQLPNGFGNTSPEVAATLPFTSGSMITGVKIAVKRQRPVVAALSSGFHHAGTARATGFCTFNGLMVAAARAIADSWVERVAIIDADYHFGDGTEEILEATGLAANVFHYSFGRHFRVPQQAAEYLQRLDRLHVDLERFHPQVILYQAGADAHRNDPLGGVLSTEEMALRDEVMFRIGRELNIPIVFNLAGGYQVDEDGGLNTIVQLHLNSFAAAQRVWG
jgi:acetoin utilization deacetylase AcuC-like enzyme